MVAPCIGTSNSDLRARSTPFWIATGASLALPYPTPTIPFSSPTTTSAVNEKRRPPLTTLATRLMSTTRSWRSSPELEIDRSGTGIQAFRLEGEATLASTLDDHLHAAVLA